MDGWVGLGSREYKGSFLFLSLTSLVYIRAWLLCPFFTAIINIFFLPIKNDTFLGLVLISCIHYFPKDSQS